MKRLLAALLVITMASAFTLPALAGDALAAPQSYVDKWGDISADGKISLTPGGTDGSMNFSWVTSFFGEGFRFGTEPSLTEEDSVQAENIRFTSLLYIANRVSLTDLAPGTYYYSYTVNGVWQSESTFEIYDEQNGFTVMFCSDPQLGRSGDDTDIATIDDTYGWERTLNAAVLREPALSFALVGGDEVNQAYLKKQWNALLYPAVLRSLPLATCVGNHDFYFNSYSAYFNNPNTREDEVLSMGGNGYYFTRGNALFIVLNSNNYLTGDHTALIDEAVANNPDAKWRVVMLHEGLYFAGADSVELPNGEGFMAARELLCPVFDDYGIDLVLSGHYHVYSRSTAIKGGAASADGTVYLSAGSASGSNFDSADGSEVSPLIDFYKNNDEPSYSLLSFSEDEIEVHSYGTDSGDEFDTFTLTKASPFAGTRTGTSAIYLHIAAMAKSIIELILRAVPFDFTILK